MTPERALQIALSVLASNTHLLDKWTDNRGRVAESGTKQWLK